MKAMTKSQYLSALAEKTGLSKKEATAVHDAVRQIATEELKRTGTIVLPGLVKFVVKDIPATKERKGKHPFTGKDHVFPAKAASKRLKATIPKGFKDAALG